MTPSVVIHDPRRQRWLRFDTPVRVVTANSLEAIQPALVTLDAAVQRDNLFAAGFLSYEAAPAFDPALTVRPDQSGFPLLWFGLYRAPEESTELPGCTDDPVTAAPPLTWAPSISRAEYERAVSRIRDFLVSGDTYQANFTFRLSTALSLPPWQIFRGLVNGQGAHYAAFVDTGSFALCSASPELFFRLDGETIEARPMKGTAPRGKTLSEDRANALALQNSGKNRAENVMIVDMIRNDLGRIAQPGTVVPSYLFAIERYPTVWQMVSTVTATTQAPFPDIMAALFPCASITGAPKPRTMEILAREESSPRRIYTGSIGYLAPERRAQFNVAIRTVLVDQRTGSAEYGVGGGIVWESEAGNEYEECWLKAKVLTQPQPEFELLETLLWTSESGFFLLDRHLVRLQDSAGYFDIPCPLADIRASLESHVAQGKPASSLRIRLLLSRNGKVRIESTPLETGATSKPVRVRLAAEAIDPADRFLYHKTTHRTVYEKAKASATDCDDVLLWNPAGEVTESTIANLVVELDGELLTPPVSCGLLPGTYRAELLEQGRIKERVIRIDDLPRCAGIFLVNSVRRWRPAALDTSSDRSFAVEHRQADQYRQPNS